MLVSQKIIDKICQKHIIASLHNCFENLLFINLHICFNILVRVKCMQVFAKLHTFYSKLAFVFYFGFLAIQIANIF